MVKNTDPEGKTESQVQEGVCQGKDCECFTACRKQVLSKSSKLIQSNQRQRSVLGITFWGIISCGDTSSAH